jgi:hypothetical protein
MGRTSKAYVRVRTSRVLSILFGENAGRDGCATPLTQGADIPHRGLLRSSLDEHAAATVAFRARKLGIDVQFVEHVDAECRFRRIRSGDRVGVIDTAVPPRSYEAALVAFARSASAA